TQPSQAWASVSGAGGVPTPGVIDTVLTGVAVQSASDVWAVGYSFDGSADRPLALHWDGTTWSNSPISGAGRLRKVAAAGPGHGGGGRRGGGGHLLQREPAALPDARGSFQRDGVDDGRLGRRRARNRRAHRPGGRPGGIDAHRGGPAGPPPARRAGELPDRAG